ncbi:putative DNA helicase [Mesomycoplasma conjunctivae]|uniref:HYPOTHETICAL Uncharacterized ATP-dependent helicase MG140 n=1 Tax=Mesomycoplasma conjunctivae (strain ATCC 25834 / NCTC 10147 / HRC/581) TaxID=572263 RepID=C5J657_MESCH|nr:DUF4011 domain-containing protein [Mesomycoplasma conjunctivae]CAT04949.1 HYPOTHETICAL Uncharacterized ATP-dependent helicase MG140 [Mesomycoplasma conjunctivae]VEU66103.1 putative DNA helicase [Mesomycoplasma conjunctivae]
MIDTSKNKQILVKNINNWKIKLLDLTLKNKAINFKITSSSKIPSNLKIIYPTLDDLIKEIAADNLKEIYSFENYEMVFEEASSKLKISNKNIDWNEESEKEIRTRFILPKNFHTYTMDDVLKFNALKTKKIYTEYGRTNKSNLFGEIINSIHKTNKSYKDSYSISILYLSFGILKWYENSNSDLFYYAPLLFLPVDLQVQKNQWSLVIKKENTFEVNESLVQKLKMEYNIDLDYNSTRADLLNSYKEYCQSILKQADDKRWEIIDDIYLTTYDFSKIHIYKDIEENIESIIDSNFFQKIVGNAEALDTNITTVNYENINDNMNVEQQFKVLDADHSQEIAIQNAIAGKSFVLQGPPGTGKSQTITNMITEIMARGKKILFVAEKNAALQVVYNNLKKIGIHKYAIPIHDSNLNKKDILTEIVNSAENSRSLELNHDKIKIFTENYEKSRKTLDEYGEVLLSKTGPESDTIFDYITKYLSVSDSIDLNFFLPNILNIDYKTFDNILNSIDAFYDRYRNIRFDFYNHKWYGMLDTKINFEQKSKLFDSIYYLIYESNNIKKQVISLNLQTDEKLIEDKFTISAINIDWLINFHTYFDFDSQLQINYSFLEQTSNDIAHILALWQQREVLIQELLKTWKSYTFLNTLGAKNSYEYLIKTISNPFKNIFSMWRQLKKLVKENIISQQELNKLDLQFEFSKLAKVETLTQEINTIYSNFAFKIDISDAKLISKSLDKFKRSLEILEESKIDNTLFKLLAIKSQKKLITQIFSAFKSQLDYLMNHFDKNAFNFLNISHKSFVDKLSSLLDNKESLDDYLSFNFYKQQLIDLGLQPFLEQIFHHNIRHDMKNIFLKYFYKRLLENVIDSHFNNKDSVFMNNNLELFKEKDKQLFNLSKDKIIMSLDELINKSLVFKDSNRPYNILKKEVAKKQIRLPFKKIFEESLEFILNVKPCLLLSPLMVSQLFKDIDFKFDVVIFDEASQIRPETAISSLFRAKQVIIVGDKEQMPPSNFFQTVSLDEEYSEANDEIDNLSAGYDSLLSLADGNLESIKLKWHYRSEFEDLIETSNKFVYKDLITFPNSRLPQQYEALNFFYAQSGTQEFPSEDDAIAQALEILKDFLESNHQNYSVGIVVFNYPMVVKVENEIEQFKYNNPQLKHFFSEELREPFFVKNIETVQGDERDYIIFIISAKRTSAGNVNLNFGAINRSDSGYKRLNVGITRAKKGLMVVSNFKTHEVDWAQSEKKGIKLLEKFMKNAEFSRQNINNNVIENHEFESSLQQDIYNKLQNQGLIVKPKVGNSDFAIDLAIVDPQDPNKFLLAIECDGTSYKNSKTSRDRDRLRQQILEQRGWNVQRIWSIDWFKNQSKQVDMILDKLESLRVQIESRQTSATQESITNASKVDNFTLESKEVTNIFPLYPDLSKLKEEFFADFKQGNIEEQKAIIAKVLDKTGAIPFGEFCGFLKSWFYESRVTNFIKESAYKLIESHAKIIDNFVVPNNCNFQFRESDSLANKRSIMDIYDEEIKHFLLTVLSFSKVGISAIDLTRSLANRIFSSSVHNNHINKVITVLSQLESESKVIKTIDDKYMIKES